MGKKKGKKKGEGEQEVVEEEKGPITVVLKVDMDCEGCSKKVKGSLKGFDGVVEVKGDVSGNQLTVVGKVDPEKIRDRVESRTKKKVVLVSPLPKKGKDSGGGGGGGDHKKEKEEKKKPEDQEKKAKEAPATTVVLKLQLHCQGCVEKIRRIISKTKGVELIEMDRQKDLVTMKGTIDFKAFLTHLQDKLKRNVQIVPAKKEAGEGKQGGKEDNKKGEEANEKRSDQEGKKMEAWENSVATDRMEYWGYGYNIDARVHAPQLFSDENPNACSIM